MNIPPHIKNPTLQDFMPNSANAEEGHQAQAGALSTAPQQVAEDAIISAIQTVHDPEIPVNLYDLGLIYNIAQDENGNVSIVMTLTAPACPVAGILPQQVADAVSQAIQGRQVTVTLTWQPTWHKDMMSEDAKLALDF